MMNFGLQDSNSRSNRGFVARLTWVWQMRPDHLSPHNLRRSRLLFAAKVIEGPADLIENNEELTDGIFVALPRTQFILKRAEPCIKNFPADAISCSKAGMGARFYDKIFWGFILYHNTILVTRSSRKVPKGNGREQIDGLSMAHLWPIYG